MNKLDRRHIALMQEVLSEYQFSRSDLGRLISELEVLKNALSSVPEGWLQKFREEWGTLEEVYSVSIVMEKSLENVETQKIVESAVEQLKVIVSELVNS